MQINIDAIKNKQRILIGGNFGARQIFELVQGTLAHINKPADYYTFEEPEIQATDAPIIIMMGGDQLNGDKAAFHQMDIHILLLHRIIEELPEGYESFDAYLDQYEKLADNLPKAGSLIYFEDDDVATLLGKKEREDVNSVEYKALPAQIIPDGFEFIFDNDHINIFTNNDRFPNHAGAALALLNRIGVTKDQFISFLKTQP